MKVTLAPTLPQVFKPTSITITFESAKELEVLTDFFGDQTVHENVASVTVEERLVNQMSTLLWNQLRHLCIEKGVWKA
jgi:hypothetical protein